MSVEQGGIKYYFLSLWYDSTWDWTLVFQTISKGRTEGFLCSSYYTEVLLLSLDCSTLPLIHTFILLSIKQGDIKYHFFKALVWRNLGFNPCLPGHWQTLYQLGQWAGLSMIKYPQINLIIRLFWGTSNLIFNFLENRIFKLEMNQFAFFCD